jgi:hypothetical protein
MQGSIDLSIAELGLSTRAKNALLGAGIGTVENVLSALEKGDETLTGISGFGAKSLQDLKEKLRAKNFTLPGEGMPAPLKALEDSLERELRELEEIEMAGGAAVTAAPVEPAPVEAAPVEPAPIEAAPVEAAPEEIVPPPVAAPTAAPTPPARAPSIGQRISATLAQPRERFRFGGWIYGVIGVVVILLLLLPPVRLLNRLGITGYETLNAANSSIVHEDGLTLSVNPETFTDRLRVRISSVPRLDFLEGSAGGGLREAAEALPPNLTVKSPLYQIKTRGESSQAVMIDAVMPNNAEPWETLDLYTWTGEEWRWVGSELHDEVAEHEFVRAHVNAADIPDNLVVVQANAIASSVSTSWDADDNPVAAAVGVLDEVNPTGLLLGTDGGFVGAPGSLPQLAEGNGYAVIPALRNWAPGATVNRGLLSDVLTISSIRDAHITNIVQLCVEQGYAGIEIDYQGVSLEEREAFTDFVSALADALHVQGLRLNVVVEPPTPTDGSWDSGGYDWAALGAAADALKAPFPEDPTMYVEGGQAHRLLDWAVAQVDRYKLRMRVSTLSTEQSDGGSSPSDHVAYVSLEQALAHFGEITVLNPTDSGLVEPGSQVEFGLSGHLLSITPQESTGAYRLEYASDDGSTRTVWLSTAASLVAKLEWARRYHLGGVAVADMLDPGNGPGIVDVVAGYRNATSSPAPAQEIQVVWTVSSATATIDQQTSPLTEPGYTWTVLASDGDYTVRATVGGFDHGSVPIVVGAPEPEVAEVITNTITGTLTTRATITPTLAVADCLEGRYVADVTVPDNTQMEKGEEFVKTWSMRNSGTCDWPEDTVLVRYESDLGGPESVPVGAVAVGETVEISIDLVAPQEDGVYDGVWGLKTGDTEIPKAKVTAVIRVGDVAAVPAVAPISGGSFELGGHIRNEGFPYADTMHYAGMNWAKVQVRYGANASGVVAAAHANGFKIQLSALGSASMVTEPGFEQDFANWVAQLAATGAEAIEVWNEPNIDREWQIGHISPQAYTKLLCASYNAIKAKNPNVAVISAAPSPTGYFGGCSVNGCDDGPWITGLRDAGAVNCMDYIGAHHNSGATSPSARIGHPADPGSTHTSWFFLPQTELYYNTFGGARKLFYTEMGYASQEGVPTFSDWFAWARGTDNAEQAAWLSEAVQLSVNTGMVRCIIVWNIDFVRYGDDPQDGYAIIRPGGGCPACDSLHNLLGTR